MKQWVNRLGMAAGILAVVLAGPVLNVSVEGSTQGSKRMTGSLEVSGPIPGQNIFRGDFVAVTMQLKGEGVEKSGPLRVRIYLAADQAGTDIRHEFDVFHDIYLDKSGSAKLVKQELDSFHTVMPNKNGGVWVIGQYVIPYNIPAGNAYFVIAEVGPEGPGENKARFSHDINVPCDALPYFDDSTSAKFPAYNFCGERD